VQGVGTTCEPSLGCVLQLLREAVANADSREKALKDMLEHLQYVSRWLSLRACLISISSEVLTRADPSGGTCTG
jgi:hypothetical protein